MTKFGLRPLAFSPLPLLCLFAFAPQASAQAAAAVTPRAVPAIRGPITVAFDLLYFTEDGYALSINAFNGNAGCRKVVGWKLGWTFPDHEFIWAVTGGVAADANNCSNVYPAGGGTPYSCARTPLITDTRQPGTVGKLALARAAPGCLTAPCASFIGTMKMVVGNSTKTVVGFNTPSGYQMPGYRCGAPVLSAPGPSACQVKSRLQWKVLCTALPPV